jgi:hypothetical protein
MNAELLRRAAEVAAVPRLPHSVSHRDVALLGAELGRPLPVELLVLWQVYGAGWLGQVSLWDPREIAQGVGMAERWIDEGLLPFAHGGDGELWLLEMDGGDDPGVVASDPPKRDRLGPLSSTVETAALALLIQSNAPDRDDLARQLGELRRSPDR